MRLFLLFVMVSALFFAPDLPAQQALPEHFAAWSASGPAIQAAPDITGKEPGEASAVLTEAGLIGITRRVYSSGPHSLRLTLYQMHDSSGALAAFSYLRVPEMVSSDVGLAAALARDRAILLSGSAVVEAAGLADATVSGLRGLAAALARSADKTPPPPVPTFLPGSRKISGSDRYVVGPAGLRAAAAELSHPELAAMAEKVGFKVGAEAALARYRDGRGEAALLLL